mmetsp:Transcript_6320/g.16962  ORF Transcript_6320/g.16962 Transcript_6320/m.16962 type:complete len:201 (-) Transcript_6320:90-692(-)
MGEIQHAPVLETVEVAMLVVRCLEPESDFAALAAVSSRQRAFFTDDEVWHAAMKQWLSKDSAIERVTYLGSRRSGRCRLRHVCGALAANARFYRSFASGRCGDLTDGLSEASTVIHPGGEIMEGRDVVRSWQRMLGGAEMPIKCQGQIWRIDDAIAVVVCGENFGTNVVQATNVYEFKDGRWQMMHHHGSHPAMPVRGHW